MNTRPDERCPHCDADLIGDEIPAELNAPRTSEVTLGPDKGTVETWYPYGPPPQYWKHTIGHEIPGVYDGVLFWSCPLCGGTWHRFEPSDGRRYAAAAKYIHGPTSPPTAQ